MVFQIAQLKPFVLATIFSSVLTAQGAMAQQAKLPEKCKPVPENLRILAAALDVCPEVTRLTPKLNNKANFAETESLKRDEEAVIAKADKAYNELEVPQAKKQTDLLQATLDTGKKHRTIDWLKVSVYIIGGVGAGLGGALRLGGHNTSGTAVTMAGGLGGAAVNLFAEVCSTDDNQNIDTQLKRFPEEFQSYVNHSVTHNQLCRNPSKVSELLQQMTAATASLRQQLQ